MYRLPLLVAVTAVLIVSSSTTALAAEKPNFIVIFIDDMGYGDIGPYGSTLNRTPNLDRMAKEGIRLTSFYAAPVCSASRAQLLTGCYAPRVSVPGVFFPAGRNGLNPDEKTVAEYLRELGYATTCVGKWHLGDQPEFLPTNQGFDHYFGIPYSNDMQRVSLDNGLRVTPLLRDDKVAELLEDEGQRRVTREYTEEAVRFIGENKEKPFFVYLPHTAMHVPLFPHDHFVGKSENGTYGDWVEEVDWSVGKVLDAVRENGLEENTLVLFTSDNGPWASKGKAGGVSGPLRGSKGSTLEGGVREPTIAWWPGQIEPESSSDAVGGTTDILPTLVSLAGGTVDADRKIDGRDLSPLLLGRTADSPHDAWFYYRGRNLDAVRSGPWKLALRPQNLGMGIREQADDLKGPGPRLYNLDEEIGEVTNVADQNPDVVVRLTKLAEEMIADIGSGTAGPGVRPAGVVENPVTLYPTRPRNSAPNKSGKPIVWDKVAIGDAYAAGSAPAIANRAFSIQCEIESKSPSGVIIAHGGSAVGYSLYAKDGEIVFAVRRSSDSIHRVSAKVVPNFPNAILASLKKDGTLKISVNGSDSETFPSSGLINRIPLEDFCIGHDNRNPLDPEAPSGRFNGTVSKVGVEISEK